MRRGATPAHIAAIVAMLVVSDYLTGEVVTVDGGLNLPDGCFRIRARHLAVENIQAARRLHYQATLPAPLLSSRGVFPWGTAP